MRKYGTVLLILCMISGLLCGCVGQSDGQAESEEELPEMTIGIDANYEPYSYVDEDGDYAGLDIELATEACSRMGLKPVFNAIKWDNKDTYLEQGDIDCIWSCFSMNGREDDYNWVGPYMYSRQVVVVRSDSEIKDLSDLTGGSVAVMSSTKPESIFLNRDGDNVPDVKDVYCMEDMNLVFAVLQSGSVDAAAGHESVVRQYMDTTSGTYSVLEDALLSVKVGVAFEKGENKELAEKLNQALKEMEEDGTLGKILEEYGISATSSDGGETP